jgi:hypothetical protein
VTTQRATEHRRHGSDDKHDGKATTSPGGHRPGDPALDALESVASQEQMVAEILHDLGNLFHKLYYWADYLRSGDASRDGDASAGEMLEGTIKQLQDYLKAAFDYLAPVALSPTRMAAADVMNSFVGKVTARLCATAVRKAGLEAVGSLTVLIDPSRMSQGLDIVVRQVASQVSEASSVAVTAVAVNHEGPAGIAVRVVVDHCADPSMFFRSAEASVEWALAEKLFDMHGGRLSHESGATGEVTVVMFFPVSG